jgi:hypothetical protein
LRPETGFENLGSKLAAALDGLKPSPSMFLEGLFFAPVGVLLLFRNRASRRLDDKLPQISSFDLYGKKILVTDLRALS